MITVVVHLIAWIVLFTPVVSMFVFLIWMCRLRYHFEEDSLVLVTRLCGIIPCRVRIPLASVLEVREIRNFGLSGHVLSELLSPLLVVGLPSRSGLLIRRRDGVFPAVLAWTGKSTALLKELRQHSIEAGLAAWGEGEAH
jgi:hypothetical protein